MTNDFNIEKLNDLSEEEKKVALKILQDISEDNYSSYNELLYQDYNEIPVDIITFLHDKKYLGNGLIGEDGRFTVFPYWEQTLKKLFPDNLSTAYNTLVLTGAIGLGKSFVAVIAMLYLLYRMLCLKNPYSYYGLQPIDHITFSLINITMDAAKGVAWSKIQELLQSSPWFMAHGTVSKSLTPVWQPNANIELIYGSQPRHVIGRAVFCLSGDTEITTDSGDFRLEDLVNKSIKVQSVDENGRVIISDLCTVQPTIKTSELIEIELEDNTIIRCTPNHKLMLKNGEYKMAKDLTEEDELFEL